MRRTPVLTNCGDVILMAPISTSFSRRFRCLGGNAVAYSRCRQLECGTNS
jgi:hypothetical protein